MMAQISYRGMCSHHQQPGSEPKGKCDQMLLFNSSSWFFVFFVCFQNDPQESSKIHKCENVYNFIVNKVNMT